MIRNTITKQKLMPFLKQKNLHESFSVKYLTSARSQFGLCKRLFRVWCAVYTALDCDRSYWCVCKISESVAATYFRVFFLSRGLSRIHLPCRTEKKYIFRNTRTRARANARKKRRAKNLSVLVRRCCCPPTLGRCIGALRSHVFALKTQLTI